jgi:hypothetical protein
MVLVLWPDEGSVSILKKRDLADSTNCSIGQETSAKVGKRLFKGIIKEIGSLSDVRTAQEEFLKAQQDENSGEAKKSSLSSVCNVTKSKLTKRKATAEQEPSQPWKKRRKRNSRSEAVGKEPTGNILLVVSHPPNENPISRDPVDPIPTSDPTDDIIIATSDPTSIITTPDPADLVSSCHSTSTVSSSVSDMSLMTDCNLQNTSHASSLFSPESNVDINRLYAIFITSCTRLMAELIFTKIDAKSLPTVKEARTSKREQK